MKVREKGPKDQPWIETLLNERWGGGGKVILHGEVFDARSLPALIAGERVGLATFQIRRVKDMAVGGVCYAGCDHGRTRRGNGSDRGASFQIKRRRGRDPTSDDYERQS